MNHKPHTFFRNAKGKPSREEKDAPRQVLAEIGKVSMMSGDGVGWSRDPQRFKVALEAGFVVVGRDGDELNEADSTRILWDSLLGIVKLAPSKPIKFEDLLERSDGLAREFYQLEPQNYLMVSSLSIEELPAKTILVNGCEMTGLNNRGRYPLPTVLSAYIHGAYFSGHLSSTKYKHIRVATAGRSVHEAIENATCALDLLRGLWSLFATYGSWSYSFGGNPKQKALGIIHTGPIHTLHNLDRSVVGDVYWFDQIQVEDRPLFSPKIKWKNIEKNRRWTMRRLAIASLPSRTSGSIDSVRGGVRPDRYGSCVFENVEYPGKSHANRWR